MVEENDPEAQQIAFEMYTKLRGKMTLSSVEEPYKHWEDTGRWARAGLEQKNLKQDEVDAKRVAQKNSIYNQYKNTCHRDEFGDNRSLRNWYFHQWERYNTKLYEKTEKK
jgi:hypothetical protein